MPELVAGVTGVSIKAGASNTGPGAIVDLGNVRQVTGMVVTTSAGVSAGSVQLTGSVDGVNFYNIGAAISTTAASTTTGQSAIGLARYLQAVIASAIVGGTVAVSVMGS